MTPVLFLLCLVFSACLGTGQLLFKLGANQINAGYATAGVLSFLSPYVVGAVALYGATTILWIYILTRLPLSVAYPFSLAGAVVVIGLAHYWLGEPVSPRQVAGIAAVLFGLAVIYI